MRVGEGVIAHDPAIPSKSKRSKPRLGVWASKPRHDLRYLRGYLTDGIRL
jgi:hypothetical protein